MSHPFEHPYECKLVDGPYAETLLFLPRRYDWFAAEGGRYVWDGQAEAYRWEPEQVMGWDRGREV